MKNLDQFMTWVVVPEFLERSLLWKELNRGLGLFLTGLFFLFIDYAAKAVVGFNTSFLIGLSIVPNGLLEGSHNFTIGMFEGLERFTDACISEYFSDNAHQAEDNLYAYITNHFTQLLTKKALHWLCSLCETKPLHTLRQKEKCCTRRTYTAVNDCTIKRLQFLNCVL